jgi:hypothetical protein
LWWVYFDRSAAFAAGALASSPDPGRLARSALPAMPCSSWRSGITSRAHIPPAIILLLLSIPIAVFLPGLAVAALAIVGLGVVVAALRGQAAVAVVG